MKKILATIIMSLCVCLIGRGDETDNVLLWMLDDPQIEFNDGTYGSIEALLANNASKGPEYKIDVVRLATIDEDGAISYLSIGNESEGIPYQSKGWRIPDQENNWTAGPMYASLSDVQYLDSSTLFLMEIGTFYNENWVVSAYASETYGNLKKSGYILGSELSYQGSLPWTGAGSWAVPEPSSMMLMLLGIGALALRRNNKKKKEMV